MKNGYIASTYGINWFPAEERPGFFPFAQYLPGTSRMMARAKLEAYRCNKCDMIIFRYGKPVEETDEFEHTE